MVYLGVNHMQQCKINKSLSIYLISGGIMITIDLIFHVTDCTRIFRDSDLRKKCLIINWFYDGLVFLWFFIGWLIVYFIYEKNLNENLGPYCHESMYRLIFIFISIGWITVIIIILLILFVIFICFFINP